MEIPIWMIAGIVGLVGVGLGVAIALIVVASRAGAKLPPTPPAPPPTPPKPTAEPLRLLGLLQREGRLVDFLMEDIGSFSDQQVGQAVREIHRQCRKVLDEHVVLEPVLAQSEGDQATVPAGFDPAVVRLVGNVTGQPPFTGTLTHRGWRVKQLRLSPPPAGQDEFVIMPAEVELA
jgi:uncharacterized protein DUF2760